MKKRGRSAQKVYTLADVMRLTGAKRPQIEYWVRKSIIRGEFDDGGTGLPRQFIFRNLVEVAVALDLNLLGVNTDVMGSVMNTLRYGDVETDVRTPWFVEATRPRPLPRLSHAKKRRLRAAEAKALAAATSTPLEDRCCAELNDDGTLKLLKLLRAYVDAGVSEAEKKRGLLAVAREHQREHQQWEQEYDDLHGRWRAFKNPATRPSTSGFWLVCEAPEPDDEDQQGLRRVSLIDESHKPTAAIFGRSIIMVKLRSMLERLEAATGDHWRATAEKKVFKSHEPAVDVRDLVANAFREYERASGK